MSRTIAIIGSGGYIGSAFAQAISTRGWRYTPIPWQDWRAVLAFVPAKFDLVLNCAAYIPPTSVAACDQNMGETIRGNVLLPSLLSDYCAEASVPFAHISTACLWSDGMEHSEDDRPQRAYEGHCGFYVGTKVTAEQHVRVNPQHYIWRVRLPFDNVAEQRNYLYKLATYDEVWDHENTLVNRIDFANACLDMFAKEAPYGTYNVLNPGTVHATDVVQMLIKAGVRKTLPRIVPGPQAGATVSVAKMLSTGIKVRDIHDALNSSIKSWQTEPVM